MPAHKKPIDKNTLLRRMFQRYTDYGDTKRYSTGEIAGILKCHRQTARKFLMGLKKEGVVFEFGVTNNPLQSCEAGAVSNRNEWYLTDDGHWNIHASLIEEVEAVLVEKYGYTEEEISDDYDEYDMWEEISDTMKIEVWNSGDYTVSFTVPLPKSSGKDGKKEYIITFECESQDPEISEDARQIMREMYACAGMTAVTIAREVGLPQKTVDAELLSLAMKWLTIQIDNNEWILSDEGEEYIGEEYQDD